MQKARFFTFTAEWQQLRQSHSLCPLFIFCKKKVTEFASCGVVVSELKTVFWCVLRVGFAHISSPYAAECGHFCSFIVSRLPFSAVFVGSLNGGCWHSTRMSWKEFRMLCEIRLPASRSAENTIYQTVKTAVYVYGSLRKLSPGQLEQCYGASVAVLQGSCNNATEPLEKDYGTPRKCSEVLG